jgi:hypothetical protein
VPLGEDEPVFGLEDPVMEGEQHIEAGEIAADVSDAALVVHPQKAQACLANDVLQGVTLGAWPTFT